MKIVLETYQINHMTITSTLKPFIVVIPQMSYALAFLAQPLV